MATHQLLGFERRGKLLLGFLLKQDDDKNEIYSETGEKIKIPINKVLYKFRSTISDENEKSMKLALKSYKESSFIEKIDLQMLWNCLDFDTEYSLSELAEFYFSTINDVLIGSLFLALREDILYFQYKNNSFIKVSSEQVNITLKRISTEEQNKQIEKNILEWLQDNANNDFDINSEENTKILNNIIQMALYGEEQANPDARRIIGMIGWDIDDLLIFLEKKQLVEKDINETIFRHNLTIDYPKNVIQESQELCNQSLELQGREIVQHDWNIAIDDAETVEIDDAISYAYEDDLHVVGIHIADVSASILPDSMLDHFALERFATLYFPDKHYSLFPCELVQKCLTLEVNQPRATISGFFYFDHSYNLVKYCFKKTVLSLKRKACYDDTSLLDDKNIQILLEITKAYREERQKQGAIILDLPEIKLRISEDHEITLETMHWTPTRKLVSECMILYNALLANFFVQHQLSAFYRVQMPPTTVVEKKEDDPLYPLKVRWSLGAAGLSLQPNSHFSLGLNAYVQGTSPIRRYSDLIMQRMLVHYLDHQEALYSNTQLQYFKIHSEKIEKNIKMAEYERNQFWLLKYLKKNKGCIFQGIISRVLDSTKIMVYIPTLLQEFPCRASNSNDSVGDVIYLKIQNTSARKKKVRLERVSSMKENKELLLS